MVCGVQVSLAGIVVRVVPLSRNQRSAVGIAIRLRSGVLFPVVTRHCSVLQNVHIAHVVHPLGTDRLSPMSVSNCDPKRT